MKKIIITCVVICSFITAKVGYNEYIEREKTITECNQKLNKNYDNQMNSIKAQSVLLDHGISSGYFYSREDEKQKELKIEYKELKNKLEETNKGFWGSIFNAF